MKIKTCLALLCSLALNLCAADKLPPPTSSALVSDPSGWIPLMTDGLADWERFPFSAKRPLVEKSPWSFDAKTGILLCEATNIHEMLLFKTPQIDGIFHVEYRYVGAPEKNNSGVFIRTATDASTWVQAQLATSGLGMVFGREKVEGAGEPRRLNAGSRLPELQKPAGEWNVLEITAKGGEVTLWINDRQVTVLKDLKTSSGHVGLEAEFYPVEFKNLFYKNIQ
jgi:hypothetical protein